MSRSRIHPYEGFMVFAYGQPIYPTLSVWKKSAQQKLEAYRGRSHQNNKKDFIIRKVKFDYE